MFVKCPRYNWNLCPFATIANNKLYCGLHQGHKSENEVKNIKECPKIYKKK